MCPEGVTKRGALWAVGEHIARVTLRTSAPLFYDSYRKNRITGSVILVDEFSNETVAAGMIR